MDAKRDFIDEQFERLETHSNQAKLLAEIRRLVDTTGQKQAEALSGLERTVVEARGTQAGALTGLERNIDETRAGLSSLRRQLRNGLVALAAALLVIVLLLVVLFTAWQSRYLEPIRILLLDLQLKAVNSRVVVLQFRSGIFRSGAADCTNRVRGGNTSPPGETFDEHPCEVWSTDSGSGLTLGDFEKTTWTQPVVVVVQGGHDSRRLSTGLEQHVHSNLQLGQWRADSVRDRLKKLLAKSVPAESIFISAARSASDDKKILDTDRTVTVTILTSKTVEPQERPTTETP